MNTVKKTVSGATDPAAVADTGLTLQELKDTINQEHAAGNKSAEIALQHAITCGALLEKAKKEVGHGKWDAWCKSNLVFSRGQAAKYMKVASNPEVLNRAPTHVLSGVEPALTFIRKEKAGQAGQAGQNGTSKKDKAANFQKSIVGQIKA